MPVLCLVGSNVTGWAESVIVSDTPNVAHALTSRRPVMSPDQVRAVANELRWRLQDAPGPRLTAGTVSGRAVPRPVRSRREPVSRASGRVSFTAALIGAVLIGTSAYTPQVATGVADFFVQTVAHESGKAPDDRPAHAQEPGRRRREEARDPQRALGQALADRREMSDRPLFASCHRVELELDLTFRWGIGEGSWRKSPQRNERRRTRSRLCRAIVGGCCTTCRGPGGRRSSPSTWSSAPRGRSSSTPRTG